MTSTAIAVSRSSSRWAALTLIVAAQFMVVLDMSIVNVALATIKHDLGFSQASLQWVITAYAIVFGGFLLLGGRLADLLGRRRVFMGGIALFTLGSALSGLAWSAGSLVVFRGIPGTRRRALRARGPLAPDDHLPGRTRAQHRPRHLGRGVGRRRRRRRPARRRPYVVPLVAVDLLHQRARRDRARPARSRATWPRAAACSPNRHFDVAGAISVTASLMVLVYALTRATQDGWGSVTTVGLLERRRRPRRRVRRDRAAGRLAAPAVRGLPGRRSAPRRSSPLSSRRSRSRSSSC